MCTNYDSLVCAIKEAIKATEKIQVFTSLPVQHIIRDLELLKKDADQELADRTRNAPPYYGG